MLKIKLFAAFAFLAFASGAFLFSNNSALAQSDKDKRDEVLEKVADYKLWKQVRKPETELDLLKKDAPAVILDSTAMG